MSLQAREQPASLVILGSPVRHSLSPVFQNAAMEARNLPGGYRALEVASSELARTFNLLRASRTGGNVTIPHKEAAYSLCDNVTETARRTGAVNTFWFESGNLSGHNTDVAGVRATIKALSTDFADSKARRISNAMVLGSGGSAASVLLALQLAGVSTIVMSARTPRRGQTLFERVGVEGEVVAYGSSESAAAIAEAQLIVNCTPLGLKDDDPLPVELGDCRDDTIVFDLVYRRGSENGTPWVKAARQRGLVAEDGLRMLVEQGAAAFELWFGGSAPRREMWQALGVEEPASWGARP